MATILVIGTPSDFERFIEPEKGLGKVVTHRRGAVLRVRNECTLRETEWRCAPNVNGLRGYHRDTIVMSATDNPKFETVKQFARQFYRTAA